MAGRGFRSWVQPCILEATHGGPSVGTNKHRTEDDTSNTMPGVEKEMVKEKASKMGLLMEGSS